MLVLREESVEKNASDLLCGDLPTVALLFGLTPIQYWTYASATSNFSEGFIKKLQDSNHTSASVQSATLWYGGTQTLRQNVLAKTYPAKENLLSPLMLESWLILSSGCV